MPEATCREKESSLFGDGGGSLPGLREVQSWNGKLSGREICSEYSLKVFLHVVQHVPILHQL